jgi:RimJ/RimL family protein N-acetyltransferase
MKTILETARLRLRELVPDDLDFMAEMLADADVMRYYPRRLTRELSSEWIGRQVERYKTDGYGLWLAEEREGGSPVGQVGLVRQTINGADECEVGYLIIRHRRSAGVPRSRVYVAEHAARHLARPSGERRIAGRCTQSGDGGGRARPPWRL